METLPPEQRQEIRRWMDGHAPRTGVVELADFEARLATSTGLAKGRMTTEERMRETRGED